MLEERLRTLAATDIYPFHMPGHKRQMEGMEHPYSMDITEIDGFDNLHEARGILREAQQKAADLYGAQECFYLINGSTCGILSAISAAVPRGGRILVARNSHKSVYHGIFLRGLKPTYLHPVITSTGIQGQVSVCDVEEALSRTPEIEAVFITSPTYDGVVSDVRAIAECAHRYGAALIVDAAHGAHFGFGEGFPENPVRQGADLVIESVHKTLPAMTQTGLLFRCTDRISSEQIRSFLSIYETSSPSYLLMAGIDRCIDYLSREGERRFSEFEERLQRFYENTATLMALRVIQKSDFTTEEAFDFDRSKILIFSRTPDLSGAQLYRILLEEYHLQMEMVSGQYVLALTTLMDTEEGFERLEAALKEIDHKWRPEVGSEGKEETEYNLLSLYAPRKMRLIPAEIEKMHVRTLALEATIGKVAAQYLYLYPPGIPIVVPGEEIDAGLVQEIRKAQRNGLTVEGLRGQNGVCVVNFSEI